MRKVAESIPAAIRRAARKELESRAALPAAFEAYRATLFDWQRRLVESTAPRKVVHSGRRSGKTHGLGGCILDTAAQYPGCTIPVFERTSTSQAARVLWKSLQETNEKHKLGMTFHHSLLIARFTNRAEVVILGADTAEAADKARGMATPAAFIDEAGSFRAHILDYLVRDVLDAALLDYRGSLTMAGTPPPRWAVGNLFYEACQSKSWDVYHTTFLDNEALPLNMPDSTPAERRVAREAEFAAMLQRNGWTKNTPRVMREWLGLWVQDNESLLYALSDFNWRGVATPDTSKGDWRFGLGIDFGFSPDPCAFVVVGWRRGDPMVYVLESYEQVGLIPSAVAAHVERLRARYNFSFIVGDTGGLGGKAYAEELKQTFHIPVEAAKKRGKQAFIEVLNGELLSGKLHIVPATNQDLLEDLQMVRRGEDGLDEAADHEASHLPDALRYTVCHQRAQAGLGERDRPEKFSLAWWREREDAMEQDELNRVRGAQDPYELSTEAAAQNMLDDD